MARRMSRLRRWLAAAILLSLLALSGCARSASPCRATVIHGGPVGRQDLAPYHWVRAEPESAGIYAYLLNRGDTLKSGVEEQLLFVADQSGRGPELQVLAINMTTGVQYVRQTVEQDAIIPTDYRMTFRLPTAGCWEFDVKAGSFSAKLFLTATK